MFRNIIKKYKAEQRRKRWLAAKLEALTDPTFLDRALYGSR